MRTELVANPVTLKELRASAWRWQSYAGRGVYVALVVLIVFAFWASVRSKSWLSPSEYAELGRRLFGIFFWINLVLVSLASIMSTANGLVREARDGTLGLLVCTPLTPRQIVFGKWTAALAQMGCLILCGLPVLATCLYLGGVGFFEVAWSTAVTVATSAAASAIGLRVSARLATAERAVLVSIAWFLGYVFIPIVATCAGLWPAIMVVPFIHPIYAAVTAHASGFGSFYGYAWAAAVPFTLWLASFIVRSSARQLEERATAAPAMPGLAGDVARANEGFLGLFRPKTGTMLRDTHVWGSNPILWKELATRPAGRIPLAMRQLCFIYFILFLGVVFLVGQGHFIGHRIVEFLFLLLAMAVGSTLFVREKEGRKMELLLATPLTAGQIARAKLLAGLVAPESIAAVALWLVCSVAWGWSRGPTGPFVLAVVNGLFLAFAYVLSAAMSLRSRTMHAAVLSSGGIICLLLFALPFAATVLSDGPRDRMLGDAVAIVHPSWLLERLAPGGPPAAWALFLVYVAVYAAVLLLLTLSIVRRIDRLPEAR